MLETHDIPIEKHADKSLAEVVRKIEGLFSSYSVNDVATSLFVSSLWLPNLASPVQHQLFTAVLASISPSKFFKKDRIVDYESFRSFMNKVYDATPGFPTLEDYLPNFDWGSVKFHHDGKNYKIFYGTEISHIYDFLTSFQILYVSSDEEYYKTCGRSPKIELRQCLRMQDAIINSITTQPSSKDLKKISMGHTEVPSKEFWKEASELYRKYCAADFSRLSGLDDYTIDLGSLDENSLKEDQFSDRVFNGTLLPAYFIRHKGKYYLMLPRSFSGVLIEKWSNIFSKHGSSIKKEKFTYQEKLTFEVAHFLRQRFHKRDFLPIVSAVYKDGKPHELLFSGYLLSRDKLVLFYVTNPFNMKKQIEEELKELEPRLNNAVSLISLGPTTLALHLERKNVQYRPATRGRKLTPEVFVILPQASIKGFLITAPNNLPGRIVFMDQFLGVMDEIEKAEEMSDFLDYLKEIEDKINFPIITLLDKFGSFRDSAGVLVPGANEPTMIMLHTQWGTDMRYESLSKFWRVYPTVDFFGHPRSWKAKQETATRVRLEAKSYFGSAIYTKINKTHAFFTSPFDKQSYEQGSASNLLMECLEDNMSRFKPIFEKLAFFNIYDEFEVIFFPYGLSSGEDFKHIRHLDPEEKLWKSDRGFPKSGSPGIRFVFNTSRLMEAFQRSSDNILEIDLLVEVLAKLNEFVPDLDFGRIIKDLERKKGGLPRFKAIYAQKNVSFPEFVRTEEPTLHDHKLARKKIAQIALSLGIKPKFYDPTKAKGLLKKLRQEVVEEINRNVSQFDFERNIGYLITRTDALVHDHEQKRITLKESLKHEVDYSRKEDYSKVHEGFVSQHKNYRYLLEKFVELKPSGKKDLDERSFKYLIALVDKLYEIYAASDSLNYQIYPLGLEVDRDFLTIVKYKVDLESMQKEYGEEQAEIELGLIGKESDRIESSMPIEKHLDDLDTAFKKDFGFSLKDMVNLLQVMARWPGYCKGAQEAPHYLATEEEIEKVAAKAIKDYLPTETPKILKFLTLRGEEMRKVLGYSGPVEDLPVWEHQKRLYRYTIRPLLFIYGKYSWGPYSVDRAGRIWMNVSSAGSLPADFYAPNTKSILRKNQVSIEEALEEKTLEIIKRYTSYAEKVNYGRGTHPQDIGEYDVLAYLLKQNILLNTECKDILGAFCLKDAKRIREKIFRLEIENGRKVKNPGNLVKVEKREEYLKRNLANFKAKLNWPIKNNPKIISIYVTRQDYWWTKFPPRPTSVKFVRIDMLSGFIKRLVSK